MDLVMMIISLISMIATVISCIIAVKARNEVKRISLAIKADEFVNSKVNINGDVRLNNNGENSGVMAGVVTGGINNNAK